MKNDTITDLAEVRAARAWSLGYVAHLPGDVLRDLALVASNGSVADLGLLRQVAADLAEGIVLRRARQEREAFAPHGDRDP